MTFSIQLEPTAEIRLNDKARQAGVDVVEYVTWVLETEARRPTLR